MGNRPIEVPNISVVMSAYNSEEYIVDAIESILGQSFQNFEFIIINDASNDRTKSLIKRFDDERIQYHENIDNLGLTKSLNLGISYSRGKYIARMDADDVSDSRRLEIQYKYMEAHKDLVVCGSYTCKFTNDAQSVSKRPINHADISLAFLYEQRGMFSHPSVMIRKKALDDFCIKYDERMIVAQDFKMWNDLKYTGRLANIPEVLLKYRYHKGSVSRKKIEDQRITRNKIRLEEFQRTLGDSYNSTTEKIIINGCSQLKDIPSLKRIVRNLYHNIEYADAFPKLWHISNFYIQCSKQIIRNNPIWFLAHQDPFSLLLLSVNISNRVIICTQKILKLK